MTDEEYSQNWRQVRIFASNRYNDLWYPSLLGAVLVPLASEFPEQEFFFTKYAIWYGVDDGDTDCIRLPDRKLPPDFEYTIQNTVIHRSIRLRFRENADFENKLKEYLDSKPEYYLYCGILGFGFEGDIGGARFSPNREKADLLHRARLVSILLCANSRLILDALIADGDLFRFEKNEDSENQPSKSTFQSVGHMISQAWVDFDGKNLPMF